MLNNANNNPLNNESPYGLINITKKTVFMIRDSTVKYLNNYSSRKRSRNTKFIKIRSFSGAKVSSIYDHVKPTIREFNTDHLILVVWKKNELNSSKTAGQMSRSVIDFTQSRKSVKNAIDMHSERNIPFVDQTVTIYI